MLLVVYAIEYLLQLRCARSLFVVFTNIEPLHYALLIEQYHGRMGYFIITAYAVQTRYLESLIR